MTQKEKELLLKDLSARLPYGVQVEIEDYHIGILKGIDGSTVTTDRGINYPLRYVKPYLRPMLSMTEAEKADYHFYCETVWDSSEESYYHYDTFKSIDWLNEHNFDFRGLIKKGLALAASQEMYK